MFRNVLACSVALTLAANAHAAPAAKEDPAKAPAASTEAAKSDAPFGMKTSPDFGKLPTYIKADSLTLNQEKRTFMYSGNVEVKQGDMTITANTLEGNYSEGNKIQQLTAKTNVLITKGQDIRGTCELAVYEAAKETVTLTQNPELTQNGSVLTGDNIIIHLRENRSEATGQVRVKMIDKGGSGDLMAQAKAAK